MIDINSIALKSSFYFDLFSYHWPNGIMYYTIDAAFTDSERSVIAAGMAHVEENSCIR